MEIVPLGDSALIVRMREQFDDAPEETLNEVLRTFQQLRSTTIPGMIELAPAYTSVAVFCANWRCYSSQAQREPPFRAANC